MRAPKLVVVTVLFALLSACAAILGLDPLEPYVGDPIEAGAGEGGADAAAELDAFGSMDGTVVGEAGEAPCSPDEQPEAPVVYVSAKADAGDASARMGSADRPYTSIVSALPLARLNNAKTIAVDEGTYVEDVTLDNFAHPVRLDGAWVWSADGGRWTRDCAPDRRSKTVLRSTRDIGLRVEGQVGAAVTVANMTIEARAHATTGPDTSGASRYGVFVHNSLLRLENVRLVAPPADPGGPASNGIAGATRACNGLSDCVTQPAAGASASDAPPASTFGTFGPEGFVPAGGAPGLDGTDGTNGTPGGPGSTRSGCSSGCSVRDGQCQAWPTITVSGDPGTCGCGGTGGKGGRPGRGGGASVGLYAVGASSLVVVTYSELVASRGGDGSPGGQGGAGGQPTQGGAGQDKPCYPQGCCTCGRCPNCGCYGMNASPWPTCCGSGPPPPDPVAGGAKGGAGMPGGKGGGGGGGAGGPSFSYVTVGGASVQVEQSALAFFPGGAGAGGAPSGPSGVHP
jgi:hypothetical protein